jgi:predicted HAD superfamily phosphohydrolase YqeG
MSSHLSRFSLRQSLNTAGLRAFCGVFSNPELIIANESIDHVAEIKLSELKSKGIKYLVFDKDNTLSSAFSDDLHSSVLSCIEEASELFGRDNIGILSNSSGSCDDINHHSAIKTESNTKLNVIRHVYKKPHHECFQEVQQHFQKINNDNNTTFKNTFGSSGTTNSTKDNVSTSKLTHEDDTNTDALMLPQPNEICMIGDRALTDVMFANMYGMYSIQIQIPLDFGKYDHPIAKIIRSIENKILIPFVIYYLGKDGYI